MDCSLQVYEVSLGPNVIGIMQEFSVEQYPETIHMIGQAQPVQVQGESTITVKMLMTREQKALFAVMTRLMGELQLSINMHERGIFLLNGKAEFPPNMLQDFAAKRHSDDEVEFTLYGASAEQVKEKRHGKRCRNY